MNDETFTYTYIPLKILFSIKRLQEQEKRRNEKKERRNNRLK